MRFKPTGQETATSRTLPAKPASANGFDFTRHMHHLCHDACTRLPELQHIDMQRIAVTFSQARKQVSHGLYASLTPMRFEGGALVDTTEERHYTVQRLFDADGHEMMYILRFYLPRFMEESFQEKLVTIFHELWHVSPEFDGDLRRHDGRCYLHTHSQQQYDVSMARLVSKWLQLNPSPSLYAFLQYDFSSLQERFGRIYGIKIAHPKLIPLDQSSES